MKQTFFLGDKCLGSREVGETWQPGEDTHAWPARFKHRNLAYCCQVCGEIWGRVWYEKGESEWMFETRNCPKHPDKGMKILGWIETKRGSFLCPFPDHVDPLAYSDDLPLDLLLHEFNLLMEKHR